MVGWLSFVKLRAGNRSATQSTLTTLGLSCYDIDPNIHAAHHAILEEYVRASLPVLQGR